MDLYLSYKKVTDFLIQNEFEGYDPYDGSNSSFNLISNSKYIRLLSNYFNKFSPVNFRPILGIKKSIQNQALGFIGRALLLENEENENHLNKIERIFINESLIDTYGYHCWDAHGFHIQMLGGYHPTGMVDVIGTEAIGRFFCDLYQIYSNPSHKEICVSVKDFFLNKFAIEKNLESFFRYTPLTSTNKWCYNASAIAAAYVNYINQKLGESDDTEFVKNCFLSIVARQKPDGHWNYSLNLETGYEKPQVDFHQGFVLDAILEYMQLHEFNEPFLGSYKKGLEFYHQKQFLPNGQGIYRYPRKWPVNIHNQAQGIITFTRAAAAGFGEEYHHFARTIAEWTIQNMQDKDGHFYFLKYPLFTNKIPYIRWSDAAMAYALAVLLEYEKKLQHQNA